MNQYSSKISRCAQFISLETCKKGFGASCYLGCCVRRYSKDTGAEPGQDLGRLRSACACPEPGGALEYAAVTIHPWASPCLCVSKPYMVSKWMLYSLVSWLSPQIWYPETLECFHKSFPLSIEEDLNPLEIFRRKYYGPWWVMIRPWGSQG